MPIVLKILALAVIILAAVIVLRHRLMQQKNRRIYREPVLENLGAEELDITEEPCFDDAQTKASMYVNNSASEQEAGDAQQDATSTMSKSEQFEPDVAMTANKSTSNSGVIIISILAKKDRVFQGYELLQTLLANGLRYGKMNIFHRHEEPNGKGAILFSLASATEPGTFELAKMGGTTCRGLTLFMRVSGQPDLSQALETMLETARQLAEDLQGQVVDDNLKPLAINKIKEWRERVRTYEQGQQTADLFDHEQY